MIQLINFRLLGYRCLNRLLRWWWRRRRKLLLNHLGLLILILWNLIFMCVLTKYIKLLHMMSLNLFDLLILLIILCLSYLLSECSLLIIKYLWLSLFHLYRGLKLLLCVNGPLIYLIVWLKYN